MKHLSNYFTLWSLIVSYSIFILCFIFNKKIPLWILLFGTCILTSTSIIGTFFHTLANIDYKSEKTKTDKRKIIIKDILCHSGPLIVLLILFPLIVNRTKPINSNINLITKNFTGRKCDPLASNYFFLSLIPAIIMLCIYMGIFNPDFIYEDDSIDIVSKIVLSVAIFCSSYQIFFNWSKIVLKF